MDKDVKMKVTNSDLLKKEIDYQLTNDKIEHYKTHVDKVIKIQSVMRQRYWWIHFLSFWWEIGNSGTT